ncbi:MAG: endonuclease/exonuclease/phosphatase family protein, partial [Bacteroidota bacterium]
LICLLLGFNSILSFIGIRPSSDQSKQENHIRVLNYNMQYLLSIWDKKRAVYDSNTDKLVNELKSHGPIDIFCAPESNQAKRISKGLGLEHFKAVPTNNLVIFSRYPIIDYGVLDGGFRYKAGAWLDIDFKGITIRVYGLYLMTNQITKATNELAENVDPGEKQFWSNVKTILSGYKNAAPKRVSQAKMIKEHAKKSPHPVLICGDFNDTPSSHVYYLLKKGMKDAFKIKGSGIGTTFRGNLPALRIDFILTDDHFKIHNYKTVKNKHSDHYAIIADLELDL